MKTIMNILISFILLTTFSCTSMGGVPRFDGRYQSIQRQSQEWQGQRLNLQLSQLQNQQQGHARSTSQTGTPASALWTGNGGKGMRLGILVPQAEGLGDNLSYLPALIQGILVANFNKYSNIDVVDRVSLDKVIAETLYLFYEDNLDIIQLGKVAQVSHMMTGRIIQTSTGFTLLINVTDTTPNAKTLASYSGTFTTAQFDNHTAIHTASQELLGQIGVQLTSNAKKELETAGSKQTIDAETALARGVTAQRQGTEIAALSYYFYAATLNPSLLEAVNRSSILNANISSGNIGDNVRNEIAWRRAWVERLTETEQFFDSFNKTEAMPYTLYYVSNEIKQGAINFQNETVSLSIDTHLHGSGIWTLSLERALQAVWDGLNATSRKDTWGLASWPNRGVTNLNAFASRSNNFNVVFELLNDQNKVIGRQTLQSGGSWSLSWSGRPSISVNADVRRTLNFQSVNANDISDKMNIRVATVNGVEAETAARNGVLQIQTITRAQINEFDRFKFYRGTIHGFANHTSNAGSVVIPGVLWGDPVINIGGGAFSNTGMTSVTIPSTITSIGANWFSGIGLTSVTIPSSVTSIGASSFADNKLASVNIPGSVTSIGASAFANNRLTSIIIPEGVVTIGEKAFANNHWTSSERQSDGSSVTRHHGLTKVTIANSVTTIGWEAFASHWTTNHYDSASNSSYTRNHSLPREVAIGESVQLGKNAFGNGFGTSYTAAGRQAGIYRARGGTDSGRWEKFDNTYEMQETIGSRNKVTTALGVTAILGCVTYAVLVFAGILPMPDPPK